MKRTAIRGRLLRGLEERERELRRARLAAKEETGDWIIENYPYLDIANPRCEGGVDA